MLIVNTVVFVGPTGTGKSTIARLLMRLHDADNGCLRIDGHNIRDLEIDSLRRSISFVGPGSFLFNGWRTSRAAGVTHSERLTDAGVEPRFPVIERAGEDRADYPRPTRPGPG